MCQTIILFDYCHDAWSEKLFQTGRWGYITAAQFLAIIIDDIPVVLVLSKRCVAVSDRGSGTGVHGTGTVYCERTNLAWPDPTRTGVPTGRVRLPVVGLGLGLTTQDYRRTSTCICTWMRLRYQFCVCRGDVSCVEVDVLFLAKLYLPV